MRGVQGKRKKAAASGAKTEATEGKVQPAAEAGDVQSVDRIRDIIFGAQMRDYEQRFQQLEEELRREAEELRNHINDRFETLQGTLRKEVASLAGALEKEEKTRSGSDQEVLQEMRESAKSLQRALESQGGEASAGLQRLSRELQAAADKLSDRLEREVEALRVAKTDRAALAELLQEIAAKLQAD